jgi:hypothetical protein
MLSLTIILTDSPKLQVGQKVTTLYGDGTIIGAKPAQIWYRIHGDANGAWYWSRTELATLIASGVVHLHDTPATSTTDTATATSTATATTVSEQLDAAAFAELATAGWTSATQDEALVHVLNKLAAHDGTPAAHISLAALAAAAHEAGATLDTFSSEALTARAALLLALNTAAAAALPLCDFAGASDGTPLCVTAAELKALAATPGAATGARSPTGEAVAALRSVLLTETKCALWSSAVAETTTPTLPNPDEYERPEGMHTYCCDALITSCHCCDGAIIVRLCAQCRVVPCCSTCMCTFGTATMLLQS